MISGEQWQIAPLTPELSESDLNKKANLEIK